ncbi:hypothetical protein KIH74_35230 [Kineosporia sp. J2-2]|uniref:WXG100 family type VII secretion target n=1 Tax=Kineosporia corallincola TaxID=2835133 RepID=A0ABS5TTY0_9ACTN|nr:hypothetical protein [Kineosporia corallincola]MBT0774250.1 hypothetical protein [Kineosporia corallincola]
MADIAMNNPGLDMDLDELNKQGSDMSEAITNFTSIVQHNLEDFKGLSAGQMTDTTNNLNNQAASMVNLLRDAGIALEQMIAAINNGDRTGSNIILG